MAAKSKKWTPARHAKFAATLAKKKAAVIGIDSPVPAPVTIRSAIAMIETGVSALKHLLS